MAHLIDKDALVAEIEKYISNYKGILNKVDKSSDDWVDSTLMLESKIDVSQHILSFIDTLEVKEVDLEISIQKSFIYHELHGDDFRGDRQIETAFRTGFKDGFKCKGYIIQ